MEEGCRPDQREEHLQVCIKSAFDPAWLLNSAKVFPLEGRPIAG